MNEKDLILLCVKELPYVTKAYAELVKRYEKTVFGLCYRYLSSKDLAEDAAQEIFLKLFHALPKFEFRSAFKTWLYSITINHCNSLLVKKTRESNRQNLVEDFDTLVADENLDTENCVAKEDDKVCVHQVINALDKGDRDLIILRFNNELSLHEIANMLDKKLSATKMKFYRSLDKFKQLYQQLCE
jgi:RNA polymerase sigma-70 factor (ECF subfamily)